MNNQELAVVICNYNGGNDTVNCIKAVKNNTFKNIDIFVVDNASTDNSVELLQDNFKNTVTILHNPENLGGSGGFGRGLRHATELQYEYIMVLDNDAFVDTDTIEKLYDYIKGHTNVGIVGAKIMMLNDRERIFDFAKMMDWNAFTDGSMWNGKLDSTDSCRAVDCDYVAATAAIIRTKALVDAGGMDEAHFIYYDDIELCQRIRMAGYQVVCLGTTKTWHRSNLNKKPVNTFGRYYLNRNCFHFFAKYLPDEKLDAFAEHVVDWAFPFLYGSNRNGRSDIFITTQYILEDFIHNVRGKAGHERIQVIQDVLPNNIRRLIGKKKRIAICVLEGGRETTFTKIKGIIEEIDSQIVVDRVAGVDVNGYDLVLALCNHVKDQAKNLLPVVYVDAYANIISDEQDFYYFQNYDAAYLFFKNLYKPLILEGISKIREQ